MVIVQGNAFTTDHPEVKRAHELGLKIFTYQEMIAELTNNTKLIAISGCHGKTTTTTMMSTVFNSIGINYLIGDGTGFADKKMNILLLKLVNLKGIFFHIIHIMQLLLMLNLITQIIIKI